MTTNGVHRVRNILDLSIEEKKKFLNSFDIMMTDCDGVIWNIFGSIPGTGAAINAMEGVGKRVVYVSNNSIRTDEAYEKRITDIGATYRQENLVHPIHSIIRYLKKINCQGLIYHIGIAHTGNLLRAAGFNVIEGPTSVEENFQNLVDVVKDHLPVEFVITYFNFNYSYPQLLRAEMYLRDPGCQLIVGVTEERMPLMPDLEFIGPAFFIKPLIESLSPEKKPIVLGKPGDALGGILMHQYGIENPKRVLFVGDIPESDVQFAHKSGFQSLLVLTGATSKEQMMNLDEGRLIPDYYADSIADLSILISSLPS
ncbi:uncharacterized protein LOC129788675 [Lutzomyia longipalpis]|uniref:uncharacterized protein LOC129788675 n=1 Tax=Lutzomyia longipalpis TaxID=7200 RepID=UPI0024833A93|nr:uncharacterized protein LOC129788675 [Lutzomyia longipalpis]